MALAQENLPRQLRVLRAQRGMSLTEAAERIGITRDTLSELERGKRHPYTPTLTKIARGYGVPVEELMEEPALTGKAGAPSDFEGETGQREAEAPATPEPGRAERLSREARLEVLRRMESAVLNINEQCRANLQAIDTDSPDRKATAKQLTNLLSQAFWSHLGADLYISEDEIVVGATRADSREERRAVRRVFAALNTLYETFDEIGSVLDSFVAGPGREDSAIIYAEERFRRVRAG